jgi:ABC-2 type transport system permease protein
MLRDTVTVAWREWRDIRASLFSLRQGGLPALILALLLGVAAPLQLGAEWVTSPLMEAYWPFLAASLVSTLITDSIAGERERHTLETLLATRMSDASILLGKVAAVVLYGVAFAMLNLVLGMIALNVAQAGDGHGVVLLDARAFLVTLVLVFLMCTFVAGVGVFISLRAASVRQAQQTFGIALVVCVMGPALAFQSLSPMGRFDLIQRLAGLGRETLEQVAMLVLLAMSVLVLSAALLRFRRGQLVLD